MELIFNKYNDFSHIFLRLRIMREILTVCTGWPCILYIVYCWNDSNSFCKIFETALNSYKSSVHFDCKRIEGWPVCVCGWVELFFITHSTLTNLEHWSLNQNNSTFMLWWKVRHGLANHDSCGLGCVTLLPTLHDDLRNIVNFPAFSIREF